MKTVLLWALLPVTGMVWAASPAEETGGAAVSAERLMARLGRRESLLTPGQYGLKYFPDQGLAFVRATPPLRVLLAAGVSTSLLEGPDMKSLVARGPVLQPGPRGAFDNGYAGIAGVVRQPGRDDWLAFYHAEDHEGLPPIPGGIPGFYCAVGLAVSQDEGASFRKIGPVITSARAKDVNGRADQGCGEPCVTVSADGRQLYVYYSDHSRVAGRGVQICLARCPLQAATAIDRWRKYGDGGFDQPGLGGQDTPVLSGQAGQADALFPHVSLVREFQCYLMVFNLVVYRELSPDAQPRQSGIYLASSPDGIRWSRPTQLLAIRSIAAPGQEVGWHPTLLLSAVEGGVAKGWLYYAYSENWGHQAPQRPHYLVGQPITLSIAAE